MDRVEEAPRAPCLEPGMRSPWETRASSRRHGTTSRDDAHGRDPFLRLPVRGRSAGRGVMGAEKGRRPSRYHHRATPDGEAELKRPSRHPSSVCTLALGWLSRQGAGYGHQLHAGRTYVVMQPAPCRVRDASLDDQRRRRIGRCARRRRLNVDVAYVIDPVGAGRKK